MNDQSFETELTDETRDRFQNSQMSKAGKLAMELNLERKRLKEELAQVQAEVEDLTPTTPTGTIDWYVKWASMILAVLGVFALSAGWTIYGQTLYIFSSCGWVFVGMAWSDRAIMIGSAISGTAVAMNMVQGLQI